MKILYLVHRLPYPPNKGDKVRSYHLLRHLAARHEVHLGTFIDDPDDEQHLPRVQALCKSLHVARLNPRAAKLMSLRGLLSGEALSLPYYRDAGLQAWVDRTAQQVRFDAVLVFISIFALIMDATMDGGKAIEAFKVMKVIRLTRLLRTVTESARAHRHSSDLFS